MSPSGSAATSRASTPVLAVAIALAGVGVAMRVNNAIRYPERWGFDGLFNERYVGRLLESFALPAPDSDWSTAHPPLFYYLSAALARSLGITDSFEAIVPARLASSAIGLAMVLIAWRLVRRIAPEDPNRALLAGGLVLFLPAHVYMSAMLNEEILAATFTSIALYGVCAELARAEPGRRAWLRDAGIGLAAGLGLLTKLSGILAIGAVAGAFSWRGLRERSLGRALARVSVVASVALAVGGWFYARNLVLYGYLYPQDLSTHSLMFEMPPGERHLGDYLRFPLATFTDPQVLNEDLLHSIWGSTYVTAWYEGHGHFHPKDDPAVKRLGTALLVLAILPTLAFVVGLVRAVRRALADPRSPDSPMVLLVLATLAGYVAFTWSNPWFATVKASYLLGIAVPFAVYASETLSRWARDADRALAIWITLGALLLGICAAFTTDIGLWNLTPDGALPGLRWQPTIPDGASPLDGASPPAGGMPPGGASP